MMPSIREMRAWGRRAARCLNWRYRPGMTIFAPLPSGAGGMPIGPSHYTLVDVPAPELPHGLGLYPVESCRWPHQVPDLWCPATFGWLQAFVWDMDYMHRSGQLNGLHTTLWVEMLEAGGLLPEGS